jgi:hypothetical protein
VYHSRILRDAGDAGERRLLACTFLQPAEKPLWQPPFVIQPIVASKLPATAG